jgi:cardiolipin synthase
VSLRHQRRRWRDLLGAPAHEGGSEPLPRQAELIAEEYSSHLDAGKRLCLQPYSLSSGNSLTPLVDGDEAFGAMLAAIEAAAVSIDVETYIWEGDKVGKQFADLLATKARAGLRVRVVADGAGAWNASALFEHMQAAGVHVAFFHPMSPWRQRWGWSVRDHRKLMLIDARIAFLGGINIGDEYASIAQGGRGWHDIHARVEGPVVRGLHRLFDDAFRYATGLRTRGWRLLREPRGRRGHGLPTGGTHPEPREQQGSSDGEPAKTPLSTTDLVAAGTAQLQALAVGRRRDRRFIQRHYQYAVSMARTRVSIFSAYFIPNKSWRRTLTRAAMRGVQVRILVPRTNDIPAIHFASRYTYQSLLDAGVRIFEYLPAMLHAKALVVDGHWCAIGSYNLDQRSLMYNWEIAIAGLDGPSCARLDAQHEADLLKSREIDGARWRERGWLEKTKERFFYFFRLML